MPITIKEITTKLDNNGTTINDRIIVKQWDTRSRNIIFNLQDSYGAPINLSDCEVKCSQLTPPDSKNKDGIYMYHHVDISDAVNGKVSLGLNTTSTSVPDINQFELTIYGWRNKQILSTLTFFIEVEESIRNDDAVEGTNLYSGLTSLMYQMLELWDFWRYIEKLIGASYDTGGSTTKGTVMGKLNAVYSALTNGTYGLNAIKNAILEASGGGSSVIKSIQRGIHGGSLEDDIVINISTVNPEKCLVFTNPSGTHNNGNTHDANINKFPMLLSITATSLKFSASAVGVGGSGYGGNLPSKFLWQVVEFDSGGDSGGSDIIDSKVTTFNLGLLGNVDNPKWSSGVLASNGKIYCIPYKSETILEIDPNTHAISTFGSFTGITISGLTICRGGVLANNGKIYGVPFSKNIHILEIDPISKTITTFNNVDYGNDDNASIYKWSGGVLAPNGKIYCIPSYSSSILVIDPITKTTSVFGDLGVTDYQKWSGGVLAPNGKIYCIPYQSENVLVIDPNNHTISTFGTLEPTICGSRWYGDMLASTGKIYCVPESNYGTDKSKMLEIDPIFQTILLFDINEWGPDPYFSWVLKPDGKMYGIPASGNDIIRIDCLTKKVDTYGSVEEVGADKWRGGVLANNGKIYGVPYNADSILVIS